MRYLEISWSCLHSLSEKERNPIFGSRGVCLFAPYDKGDKTVAKKVRDGLFVCLIFLTVTNGKLMFREEHIFIDF